MNRWSIHRPVSPDTSPQHLKPDSYTCTGTFKGTGMGKGEGDSLNQWVMA